MSANRKGEWKTTANLFHSTSVRLQITLSKYSLEEEEEEEEGEEEIVRSYENTSQSFD